MPTWVGSPLRQMRILFDHSRANTWKSTSEPLPPAPSCLGYTPASGLSPPNPYESRFVPYETCCRFGMSLLYYAGKTHFLICNDHFIWLRINIPALCASLGAWGIRSSSVGVSVGESSPSPVKQIPFPGKNYSPDPRYIESSRRQFSLATTDCSLF